MHLPGHKENLPPGEEQEYLAGRHPAHGVIRCACAQLPQSQLAVLWYGATAQPLLLVAAGESVLLVCEAKERIPENHCPRSHCGPEQSCLGAEEKPIVSVSACSMLPRTEAAAPQLSA